MHTPRLEAMNLANAVVGATATHTTPTTLLLTTTDGDGHSVIVCTQTENGAAGQAVVKTLSQSPAAIPSTPVYFTLATNPTRTPAAVGNSGPTLIKQRSLPTPVTLVSSQTATTTVPTGSKKKSSSSGKAAQTTPSQQPNKNRIIKFHEYKVRSWTLKARLMAELLGIRAAQLISLCFKSSPRLKYLDLNIWFNFDFLTRMHISQALLLTLVSCFTGTPVGNEGQRDEGEKGNILRVASATTKSFSSVANGPCSRKWIEAKNDPASTE